MEPLSKSVRGYISAQCSARNASLNAPNVAPEADAQSTVFHRLASTNEVMSVINPETGIPYTVDDIQQSFKELCDMGLAYEFAGRYYAMPGLQIIEVDEEIGDPPGFEPEPSPYLN